MEPQLPNHQQLDLTSRARPGRPPVFGRQASAATADALPPGCTSILDYKPSARQAIFHACPAEVVLYGGAAGGGKSMALLAEAWTCLREVPGSYGVLMRQSFPELERSLILKSKQLFPRSLCKYNEILHRWTIKPLQRGAADSILDFCFAKNCKEAESLYKSAEFTFLGIDEVTLNDWDTVRFLMSRSRTSIKGAHCRIVFGSNPGGIGHFWCRQYFGMEKNEKGITAMGPEIVWTPEPTEDDPMPLSRCFIPAKLQDNPHIDSSYVKKLSMLPPETRRMLRDGDWDVFEGRFFHEFTTKNIIDPFEIPKHWKIYRSVDYGYSAPFCCLWFAAAPDGHFYVFREIYMKGLRDIEQAQSIKAQSPENVEYTIGDPSMRNKNASGTSPAENYMTYGNIAVYPGDNDRPKGWMACRNMLALHPDGTPILKVFASCRKFIGEVQDAVYGEKKDGQELDDINIHSRRDHAIDAWRYFASSRPMLPEERKVDPYANLDEASRREWRGYDKRCNALKSRMDQATLHEINRDGEDWIPDIF